MSASARSASPQPSDDADEETSAPIVFEVIADATDLVDHAYQPVCRVQCEEAPFA